MSLPLAESSIAYDVELPQFSLVLVNPFVYLDAHEGTNAPTIKRLSTNDSAEIFSFKQDVTYRFQ